MDEAEVERIWQEIIAAYLEGDKDIVLAKIDAAMKQEPPLPEQTRIHLQHFKSEWEVSLDTNYQPPVYPKEEMYSPLHGRLLRFRQLGKYEESLRYAWKYFQYCPAGTSAFDLALERLIDSAALFGDLKLARHAAELYLCHQELVRTAIKHPVSLLGYIDHKDPYWWTREANLFGFIFPLDAAILGITQDPASCWITILERAIYEMPLSFQYEAYERALEALRDYYAKMGDEENVERLQRDHPRPKE